MQYSIVTKPNETVINEIVDVYTKAFQKNRLFYNNIFCEDIATMRFFLDVAVRFAARTEKSEFALSRTENGKLCAAAIWRFPNSPVITITSIAKAKLGWKLIWFFITKPRCAIRIIRYGAVEDQNRYPLPHYYLFFLGSVRNGEGAAVVSHSIDRYQDYDLYLESSGLPDSHHFYRSFGFELIGESDMYGEKNGYLVLKRIHHQK